MAFKTEGEALAETKATYEYYKQTHRDAMNESEMNADYFLGKQWSSSDIKQLTKKGLPYLTKNLILPIINRVHGMEIANQTDMVVVPAEGGLDEVAHAMTKLNFYYKRKNWMNYEMSQLFLLGMIMDMGCYIRPFFTTKDNIYGDINFNVIKE